MADIHAPSLQTSNLDRFIFAPIGTEPNGSVLTVLSLLARLGSDPWFEARRLADQPRKAAVEWLAERIAITPLAPEDHDDARQKAANLVALLPEKTGMAMVGAVLPLGQRVAPHGAHDALFGKTSATRWTIFAVIWTVLAVGAAVGAGHGNTFADKAPPPKTLNGAQ